MGNYTAIMLSRRSCKGMYGKVVDEMVKVVIQLFSGEVLDVIGPVDVVPDRDDDKFSEIKVRRGSEELRYITQRGWEIVHYSCDGCVCESFELFEMRN